MDSEELKQLLVKLAGIAERLDARSESAVQRVEHAGAALDQRARWLADSADGFTQSSLQAIKAQAGAAIDRGVGQAAEQCNARLRETSESAASVARELDDVRSRLSRERRTWLWFGLGALAIGSLLSVAAAGYAVMTSKAQVERHRIEAVLLRAYNEADVTLCDSQLCAHVDAKGPRHGENKQYQRVMPRAQPQAR